MAWTSQPIHFVDFEGSLSSGVLEYAVVTFTGSQVNGLVTRLCAPTGRIDRADTQVHGLSREQLAGLAPFSADWEVFASRRESGPFAAHFAGAEHSLLTATWPYPRSSPDFARPGGRVTEWGPWIDSAKLYAQLYPSLGSGRLEEVVRACGLQDELERLAGEHVPRDRRHYHAAPYDALAGALLVASLARHPQTAGLTVLQLLALSTLDPRRREGIVQRELF
jgi:DNA polymerase III epsilon subunit-like protein